MPLVPDHVLEHPAQEGPDEVGDAGDEAQGGVPRQHLLPLERLDEAQHVPLGAHLPVVEPGDLTGAGERFGRFVERGSAGKV